MAVLLTVDLQKKEIHKENITELQRDYLGGLGVNTRLALDLIPAGCPPLGEENVLLFGVGSLVGSNLPTACRTDATSKSPLSGRFGSANSGGGWGIKLARAGYQHLALKGRAEHTLLLCIDDERVSLEEASHLKGKDTRFTTDWVHQNRGKDFEVACIGPAGENLVTFASIQNNYHGSWGRTGLGAVMGSKNIKAIAVKGSGRVAAFHDVSPEAIKAIRKEALQKVKEDSSFGWTQKYGSMIVSTPFNKLGALPGRNFTRGFLPGWEKTRGRKTFLQNFKERNLACPSCPLACSHWSSVKEGPFKGFEFKGPEVSHVLEFGARLDLQTIPEIMKCVELCNNLGMDVISTAALTAFLIECHEKGLVAEEEIGFTPAWGDLESISKIIQLIAYRQKIGSILAEGVKSAAAKIKGSQEADLQVKGLELTCRDPRFKPDVWAMGYLTNTRGGDHLRARSPAEMLSAGLIDFRTEELGLNPEEIENLDMPPALKKEIFGDPPAGIDIPQMMKYAEELITIINSTGLCIRPPVLRTLGPVFFARALNSALGSNYSAETLLQAAEKIWDLQHRFNVREGETKSEYRFPRRFYMEELPGEGTNIHPPLFTEDVEGIVESYFALRKW